MTNTMTFRFPGIYNLTELADELGKILKIKLRATEADDTVHGFLSQAIVTNEQYPEGNTILQVVIYGFDEAPNWNDETKEGHMTTIKKYVVDDNDYMKINDYLLGLEESREIKPLTKDEIDKILNLKG